MPTPRVLALGGHELAEGAPLVELLLELTGVERPRVLFVPTASGDSDAYVARFYAALARRSRASHLTLFGIPPADLRERVLEQDAIFVGGGNTANMLAVWRLHGVAPLLREAWERGVVLSGVSAGSICWFRAGVTDSYRKELDGLECLSLLPGSNCPHYDGEEARRPAYHRLVEQGFPAGVAADDGCGLLYEGTRLVEVVSERRGARAYRVERVEGVVREEAIEARLLP